MPVPVIRIHTRHGGACLDRLVGGPLDDGSDLGGRGIVDVVVHTRQLEVVVGGVGRVVSNVEGLAADGVQDVGVCDPDGCPRRRALYGAVCVAQLSDILCRGRREWRPGDKLVAMWVPKGSEVDCRVGNVFSRDEGQERGGDEIREMHLDFEAETKLLFGLKEEHDGGTRMTDGESISSITSRGFSALKYLFLRLI